MRIICATAEAAVYVLTILYDARLQPLRDFAIQPVVSTTPPLIFTITTELTTEQETKIRAVVDTTISG